MGGTNRRPVEVIKPTTLSANGEIGVNQEQCPATFVATGLMTGESITVQRKVRDSDGNDIVVNVWQNGVQLEFTDENTVQGIYSPGTVVFMKGTTTGDVGVFLDVGPQIAGPAGT